MKIAALIMIFGLIFEIVYGINTVMDLTTKINQGTYAGILALGDVHGEYDAFFRGVTYAKSNGLFSIQLGDLVDHGDKSFECVMLMKKLLDGGDAAFVIGNHELKYARYAVTGKTQFQAHNYRTLYDVGEERQDEFLQIIIEIINHPLSSELITYNNVIFSHGGVHANVWGGDQIEMDAHDRNRAKSLATYGESDGFSKDANGFPVRTYRWADDVPAERYAVVGHDAYAMGKEINNPHRHVNDLGGNAIFLDTHSGRGGVLSGAVFVFTQDGLNFSDFVSFN